MSRKKTENIFSYKKLTDNISTSGQPTEEEIEAIIEEGFEVVIYLALLDSKTAIAGERALIENAGLIFEHIPVVFKNPLKADFDRFCDLMAKYKDRKCFIHCEANMRVSVFMALYRIKAEGWIYDKAIADVHDIWKPDEVWSAFIQDILNA